MSKDGMSTKEILMEVRDDVKALLKSQGAQNGRIAANEDSIGNLWQGLRDLGNRFWGLLIGLLGLTAAVILGIVLT